MRTFGGWLMALAALIGIYALFFFDTSVSTGLGRVHNLGLMQDRQNLLIAACAAGIVGTLLMLLGGSRVAAPVGESGPARNPSMGQEGALETRNAVDQVREALAKDNAEGLKRVLAGGDVRGYGELATGRGFLQFAVASNAVHCIPLLIAAGAEARQRDSAGKTAIETIGDDTLPVVRGLLQGLKIEDREPAVNPQVAQLEALRASGVLSEAEFASARSRI